MENAQLKKRMIIMLIALGILFGCILIYKVFMMFMLKRYLSKQVNIVTVSSMRVKQTPWESLTKAVGSARAIRGVNVTSELAGKVNTIYFTPGATVNKDDVLVVLNISSDVAQLESLKANAALALITYNRDKLQYAAKAISKQVLDTDRENLKSAEAQVEQQSAIIGKKIIRAPFAGRLGISAINPGQYINPGDKVVTLQQLDPIYIDFYVPQQTVPQLHVGDSVTITVDSFPNEKFTGKITTIDPLVDNSTRNAEVEATVDNPKMLLLPGMFTNVEIKVGAAQSFITAPQTAISFNPYGNIVYVIRQTGEDKLGAILIANQVFVKTGEVRGDQITVLEGLKPGDTIVTSGQLKLKNGYRVAINNKIVPENSPTPVITNY